MVKEDLEYFKSEEIVAGGSAKQLRDGIKKFYKDQFGVDPVVTLECEVDDGTIDSTCSHVNVTDHVYQISIPKSINRPSVLQVMIWPNTTMSDIEFIYPEQIQLSTPTLEGSFFLTCGDLEGNVYRTDDIYRSASSSTVYGKLIDTCPWLRDAIQVWNGRDYSYTVDGIDFIIYYPRFKGVLPPITINDSLDDPLVGTNVTIFNDVVDTYGPNVYYDVLPFEQLFTYNTVPQIRATIDGMPVLCVGTECGYSYQSTTALIQGMTVVGLDVQITGIDLPLDLTKVQMANQDCIVSTNDAMQISCSIAVPLSAGSWVPKVWTAAGLVPIDPALGTWDVSLVVDSMTPAILKDSGGDIVTFAGSGFPWDASSGDLKEITFTDGTVCNIISSIPTELVCETEPFETNVRMLQAMMNAFVNVNGIVFDIPFDLQAGPKV